MPKHDDVLQLAGRRSGKRTAHLGIHLVAGLGAKNSRPGSETGAFSELALSRFDAVLV